MGVVDSIFDLAKYWGWQPETIDSMTYSYLSIFINQTNRIIEEETKENNHGN